MTDHTGRVKKTEDNFMKAEIKNQYAEVQIRSYIGVRRVTYLSTEPLWRNANESIALGFLKLNESGKTLLVTGAGKEELARLALQEPKKKQKPKKTTAVSKAA